MKAMSLLSNVKPLPADKINAIEQQFKSDQRSNKINLNIGVYKDQNGETFIPESVLEAKHLVLSKPPQKEYIPIEGNNDFRNSVAKHLFGENSDIIRNKTHSTVQCIGGTGAFIVCAKFLLSIPQFNRNVYLPQQTWEDNATIFADFGFGIQYYRYWNKYNYNLDFEGLIEDISNAPFCSIVMFQAIAHNPCGLDPTPQQWQQIIAQIKQRKLFAILDVAYQGFATGDIEKDGFVTKMFANELTEFAVALTFSKNMGLYGERIGSLSVVCASNSEADNVMSQLKQHLGPIYLHPPISGARIVTEVLNNPKIYDKWLIDVKAMTDRVNLIRTQLWKALMNLESSNSRSNDSKWDYIGAQVGWYWFTGFNGSQIEMLRNEFAVYISDDGRVNLTVINEAIVEQVANAMHNVSLK